MADIPQTLALLVLSQNYRGPIVNQINLQSQLLKLLPFVEGAGKNCAFAIKTSGIVAEEYDDGDDATNFGSNAQADAVLQWSLQRANFRVTGLAQAAARKSTSPLGNLEPWADNMVDAAGALASRVNGQLYVGAGTGRKIAGLDVAIGDLANTYATIDRTTNADWRPTVVDPGSPTALTLALLRDDIRKIYEKSGFRPDLAMVSPTVFNIIGALFDPNRNYMQDTVNTKRGRIQLDAGFEGIRVDGTTFIQDKDCPNGKIYYINTNYTRVEYLLDAPPVAIDGQERMPTNDGFGITPLGMTVERLGKKGDSDAAQCKTYIQLVVDRPNACGVRKNVKVS